MKWFPILSSSCPSSPSGRFTLLLPEVNLLMTELQPFAVFRKVPLLLRSGPGDPEREQDIPASPLHLQHGSFSGQPGHQLCSAYKYATWGKCFYEASIAVLNCSLCQESLNMTRKVCLGVFQTLVMVARVMATSAALTLPALYR